MSNAAAAITLALAGTFAAGAADAHDHRNHYHRGPEHRYVVPQPRYYAPPPARYYAPPPVYVQPVPPTVYCSPRFNRYGEEVGSIRQNQNPYTGQLSRPYASRELCY